MKEKKKKIAAIAAVANYIKTEQELLAMVMSHEVAAPLAPVETLVLQQPAMKLWGVSGRHEQMQLRCMVQMKAFQRSKFNQR